ncbi:MAG: hypothetical protein P8N21_07015 [Opitutales bacterium]|nr:hypothetical protein [Opitutales bacterium]
MKNFANDADYLDILSTWHGATHISPKRRKELLHRLSQDANLRTAVADEIEMAGLIRAAQSGEPRWLKLEEILNSSNDTSVSFEDSVLRKLHNKQNKSWFSYLKKPSFAWLAMAATLITAFVIPPKEQMPNGIAWIIKYEGSDQSVKENFKFQRGEKFEFTDGLVEIAFQESGVHLIGKGPLEMTVIDNNRLFLNDGEIKLVVPPQGIGFVVDTMERKFVDLGTSFVVQASNLGSRVLVLDGEIAVGTRNKQGSHLMTEGGLASFDRNGSFSPQSNRPSGVPEIAKDIQGSKLGSLLGSIIGFPEDTDVYEPDPESSPITNQILPLVRSNFSDLTCLDGLKEGQLTRFRGIAGTYDLFPKRTGLVPYCEANGWIAWYRGKIKAPKKGRFRFWGYADNNLLVAINGHPIFEGSRYDSSFRTELKIPRNNHPSFPCLNARAGFASGQWFEAGKKSVKIDLLFGESRGNKTSSLLLIEHEGANYEKTYWGQPKWPLFTTEAFSPDEEEELKKLRTHMEEKIMGSFSLPKSELWSVVQ